MCNERELVRKVSIWEFTTRPATSKKKENTISVFHILFFPAGIGRCGYARVNKQKKIAGKTEKKAQRKQKKEKKFQTNKRTKRISGFDGGWLVGS